MIRANITAGPIAPVVTGLKNGLAHQVREAMEVASAGLQHELRSQITGSGLGSRLAQTWRRRVYPDSGSETTLSPAALVWSKAGTLVQAYNEGTVIRARNGKALAIPTEWVPLKAGRGKGGTAKPMTPVEVEARFNRDLRYVPLKNGNAVLIMDQVILGRSGKLRRATAGRRAQGRRVTSKIMFVLVRQVKVKKRIDIEAAAAQAQGALAGRLAALAG